MNGKRQRNNALKLKSCKKADHLDEKTDFKPPPEFTYYTKTMMLEQVILDRCKAFAPTEHESIARDIMLENLQEFLRNNYNHRANLRLFGSSRNGFAFKGSDLDISLTFTGIETGERLDSSKIIEEVASVMGVFPCFDQVKPIPNAKVPIVKFRVPEASIEGDISLYNPLAQRNTTLLSLYAAIDKRCKLLVYVMKAMAKQCGIGDASQGSLSSYAYTLMVIYFLQQRKTPVLPVLQELYEGTNRPEVIVRTWDTYFYEDIANLHKVWPEIGQNKESVGELWLGLLRFYTEEFDFRRHVVAIKQKSLLTTFEKQWSSAFMCIEDPFDLGRNLGSAMSKKMAQFIRMVFLRARERFGTPPVNYSDTYYETWVDYFFDVRFLTDGQKAPTKTYCCRVCGKIGHSIKACPDQQTSVRNCELLPSLRMPMAAGLQTLQHPIDDQSAFGKLLRLCYPQLHFHQTQGSMPSGTQHPYSSCR